MKHVDLYFDFVSPYPWLASHQLSELRGCTAAKFCFVPVLSAALLDHHSNMGPASIGYATTPATFSVQSSGTRAWLVAVALIRAGLNSLISNSLTQRECVAVSEQRKPPRLAMPLIPDKAAFQNSLGSLPLVMYQRGETVIVDGSKTGRLLILKKGCRQTSPRNK
jgi:hypothetical protein